MIGYRNQRPEQAGFTLIEVLVALVVVAIAVAALARIGSQALDSQFEIEQRTFALWVADNVIAEMRLDPPGSQVRRQGVSSMGERDWYWDALIQPAPGDAMLRIDVAVYRRAEREAPLLTHTGFLPK